MKEIIFVFLILILTVAACTYKSMEPVPLDGSQDVSSPTGEIVDSMNNVESTEENLNIDEVDQDLDTVGEDLNNW
jgi:hypothetical protein